MPNMNNLGQKLKEFASRAKPMEEWMGPITINSTFFFYFKKCGYNNNNGILCNPRMSHWWML